MNGYGYGRNNYKSDYEMGDYGAGPYAPIRPRGPDFSFGGGPPPPPNGMGYSWPYPRPYLPQASPYSRSAYYPSYGAGPGMGFGGF